MDQARKDASQASSRVRALEQKVLTYQNAQTESAAAAELAQHAASSSPSPESKQQEGAAIDLSAFLETLADQGCNEVLVEAGATLNASFLSEGLWDEMIVYMAPLLMGDTARPLAALGFTDMDEAISSTVKSIETLGPDLRIILIP